MALAVDTKYLLHKVLPDYEEFFNDSDHIVDRSGGRRRFQLQRVCVYAVVTHNAAARAQFDERCGIGDTKQRAALDWQAEQSDDEDEVEVLHHLKHLAATTTKPGVRSGRPSGGVDSRAGTTTLVASVQSPTFTSCVPHRPPSSRRYSVRSIGEIKENHRRVDFCDNTSTSQTIPNFEKGIVLCHPRIISTDAEANYHSVIWFVQLDFFDHSSQSPYFPSRPGKSRRTFNPFHHISPRPDEEHATRAHDYPGPETKRFKGVRYRPDHNRWVAEMKPPKSKNKVSFGEFRTQTDAARVVDVAFHHYGRPLNFPDSTPCILSSLPPSAGLSAEAKLKDQIKWIKDILPTLQPSPPEPGATSSTPNPSTSETNSGLRPISAIGTSVILVATDDADDAALQPQLGWLQALLSSGGMADGKETYGAANRSGDGPQTSPMQQSAETAIAHDLSDVFRTSPEHCGGTLTTVVSSQPIMDVGGPMPVDYSTKPPLFSIWSLGAFQVEGADGSWEQEIAVGCDELLESSPLDSDAWMTQIEYGNFSGLGYAA